MEIRHNTAASFSRALKKEGDIMRRKEAAWYRAFVNHAEKSIRFGSSVTGSPGQPYRTGNLRDVSFYRSGSLKRRDIVLGFDLKIAPYAPRFEYPRGDFTLRSAVGGFHSVKITVLNSRLMAKYELDIVKAKEGR